MKKENLVEDRLENEWYEIGAFWLVGRSVTDIINGKFKVVGNKYFVDYDGKPMKTSVSSHVFEHKRLWRDESYKQEAFKETDIYTENYAYFPRGRVVLHNHEYYMYLPSVKFNLNKVLRKLVVFYKMDKRIPINFEFNLESEDEVQSSHYGYQLEENI